MVKQLKNRYSDPTRNKRFMIGVDRAKMRLFDLDEEHNRTYMILVNKMIHPYLIEGVTLVPDLIWVQ